MKKDKSTTRKRKKMVWLLGGLLAILLLALAALDARLAVRTYAIASDKIKQPVTLALITDLHSCRYGEGQAELAAAIDRQAPDAVLLGGDIFDDVIPHAQAEMLLKSLAGRYPCYYVTGNHEYWSRDMPAIEELLQTYGVHWLQGNCQTVPFRGQAINLCGVDDPDALKYTAQIAGTEEQLQALQGVAANGLYTVLLSHRPELAALYAAYPFDLVLAGHAHGGQWRLPGLINGLLAPGQGFLPKYAGGQYALGHTTMIVSRGLARKSTRIPRLFNRPELVLIRLQPAGQ